MTYFGYKFALVKTCKLTSVNKMHLGLLNDTDKNNFTAKIDGWPLLDLRLAHLL
jgi:hypothetical protein